MKKTVLVLVAIASFSANADLRKDKDSMKNAKLTLQHIVKEGKGLPKGVVEKAFDEIKDICSKQVHKGCFFWKKGSSYMFQPLDNKGKKDGKIYELDSWLKKVFK